MIRIATSTPPDVSRRRATQVTVFALGASIIVSPRLTIELATSLVGLGAAVAIAAGFGPRGSLSLKPWLFTTVAVVTYGVSLALPLGDTSVLLNGAGFLALVSAATAAYSQRASASIEDFVEVRQARHSHRNRWGAAWVTVGVLLSVVSMQVAALLETGSLA